MTPDEAFETLWLGKSWLPDAETQQVFDNALDCIHAAIDSLRQRLQEAQERSDAMWRVWKAEKEQLEAQLKAAESRAELLERTCGEYRELRHKLEVQLKEAQEENRLLSVTLVELTRQLDEAEAEK